MSRCATCGSRSRRVSHAGCRQGDEPPADRDVATPEIGGYHILERIARGGFGTVYRARRGAELVALKVAHDDPGAIARLQREAEILARVDATCVPRFFEVGSAGGTHFLAIELIEAPTLGARMVDAPVGMAQLVALAAPIADALDSLHSRGVVHRDVSPENILVGERRTTLLDFGLARTPRDVALTGTGAGAGTATYIAPEQVAGDAATAAADVYGLGVILYELATAFPPFVGADSEVCVAHQSRRPRPPSERAPLPAELEATILTCLAKDPGRRPTSSRPGSRPTMPHRSSREHRRPPASSSIPALPSRDFSRWGSSKARRAPGGCSCASCRESAPRSSGRCPETSGEPSTQVQRRTTARSRSTAPSIARGSLPTRSRSARSHVASRSSSRSPAKRATHTTS